uniref:Uncharacterized protein n=1 Tax=Strigamia maritima TaxID=126957 RepID=T1JFU5_STRMM
MKLLLCCCLLMAVAYCQNQSSAESSTVDEPKTNSTMSQHQHAANTSSSVGTPTTEALAKMDENTAKPTPVHGASIKGNGNSANLISITPFLFVLSALGFVF